MMNVNMILCSKLKDKLNKWAISIIIGLWFLYESLENIY